MRVAALFDIHGNLPALEAVLADLERHGGADEIVVGGDVLWGPMQSECVERLEGVGASFIAGNCERDVLSPSTDIDRWCYERLGRPLRREAASWPLVVEFDVNGVGPAVFCHATPHDDEAIVTRITPDDALEAAFAGVDAPLVVCGHTHVQFDRQVHGGPRLVNAGSVGLAYEDAAGAYWALLGPGVDLRRTEYDVDLALDQLRSTGIPRFEEIIAPSVRGEVSAQEATAEFEGRRGD